mgnify:CR=1 FL=1
MTIKLADIAEISLGTILTRVNALEHDDALEVDTISMQEVSYYCGKTDYKGEALFSKIKKDKINSCEFTKKDDIVLGLTSKCAMVIDCCRENKLVASNFLRIRIHDTNLLNPMYLCWLFNESDEIKKCFKSSTQGNGAVTLMKAQDIRKLEINVIPILEQEKIAKFYQLYLDKYKVDRRLTELKLFMSKYITNNYYKGAKKNENK